MIVVVTKARLYLRLIATRRRGTRLGSIDRTIDAGAGVAGGRAAAPRMLRRRRRLPGGRAVVGGFLVAAAAVATFAAYLGATSPPERQWVVAAGDVAVGQELALGDLALIALDLPEELAGRAFDDPETLVGALAMAPLSRYDLVQASHVMDSSEGFDLEEVSFPIDPARAVAGGLRRGDRVDVVASYRGGDAVTEVVAGDVLLLDIDHGEDSIGASGSLTLTVGIAQRQQVLALAHGLSHADLLVVRTSADSSGDAPTRFRPEPAGQSGSP